MARCRILLVQTGSGRGPVLVGSPEAVLSADVDLVPPVKRFPQALLSAAPDLVVISHTNDRAAAIRAVRDTRALCAKCRLYSWLDESAKLWRSTFFMPASLVI